MNVAKPVQDHILKNLGASVAASGEFHDDFWIQVEGKDLVQVLQFLREDDQSYFDSFVDLCGVDYLKRAPRFESVIHLYSTKNKHRIRVRCLVDDQTLTVPSITNLWKGANWQERESFDMYGILYDGHPDLKRILTAPGTKVFPQRKDYPLKGDREPIEDLE